MSIGNLTEDNMLSEIATLRKQLSFANAQSRITEAIITNDDTKTILQTMTQIIGETLSVDRSLIYDIDFKKHLVIGMCEWLNPDTPNLTATKDTYSRDFFLNGTDYMMETHNWLQSHADNPNPITVSDDSGEILHKHMQVKSGFWFPFSIHNEGYYCLVFNQVNHIREWNSDEINFIYGVAKQVEFAIQKINFLNKQKLEEKKLKVSQLRLQALLELNHMGNATIEDISRFIVDKAIKLTGSEIGFIGFLDDNETKFNLATCSNDKLMNNSLNLSAYSNEAVVLREVVQKRSPIIVNDIVENNRFINEFLKEISITKMINVPIFEGNKIVMIACLINKNEDYNDFDVQQITLLIEGVWQIIQRNKMEEMLRLSEERFSKAFIYSPISMAIQSTISEKFISANESCLTMHGYSSEEFIDRSPKTLNLWVDMEEKTRFLRDINEKGYVHNHEVKVKKKSGEIFLALISGVIVYLNGEECILEIKTNITELRRYQKEIARLDKLNVIGQMAAGIAHEIRNPMTTVRGFLQILEENEMYKMDKDYFNLMIDELDRVNSIIIEFLSLAKNKSVDLKKQDLNNIIKVISPLIQADAMLTNIIINMNLETIPELPLSDKEIRQLIINLVRNGIEAMPNGGTLTIKTYLDGTNGEVVLLIQDQGNGIDAYILEKIGTPFFTTKDNGTGLGLATSYSIANRHNAKIEINTSSEGTIFYVKFKI